MAEHYSAGTIETNFDDPLQQDLFQLEAYVHQAVETGEYEDEETARFHYLKGSHSPIFDQDGPNFYNMDSFDAEAARFAIDKVFTKFPNQTPPLTATMGVAFWCSQPRMGEFWGLTETFPSEDLLRQAEEEGGFVVQNTISPEDVNPAWADLPPDQNQLVLDEIRVVVSNADADISYETLIWGIETGARERDPSLPE